MNFTDAASTTAQQYYSDNSTSITAWTEYVYVNFNFGNIILGLPINCYILWLMLTGRGTGVLSDFFTFNLAVCEIFYCSGELICFSLYLKLKGLQSFISAVPIYGRPLFLCLICVERYVAVVYPVTFLKYKTLRYRLILPAVVWVLLVGFGVFCMLVLSSHQIHLFFFVALPQYLLFLMIKLLCGLAIHRTLKHPGPGERAGQREEANHMKKKAMNIILIYTVTMFFEFTPLLIGGFLYGSVSEDCFAIIWTICICVSITSGFVHPFMYIRQFGKLELVTRILHLFH